MSVAIALWSLTVKPGEPTPLVPAADIQITNVALGDDIADEKGRTVVKIHYKAPGQHPPSDDEEDEEDEDESEESSFETAVLCSLVPGRDEQRTVSIVLSEDEEYLIELTGKNTVYLMGNYIDAGKGEQSDFSDEDDSEDGYDLRDVSSDVEVDPNELDMLSDDEDRFEEIVDEPPKEASKKRPRESDATESEQPSKAEKKKQKKQKGENGEAVEAPTQEKKEKGKQKEKEKGEKEKKPKGETKTLAGGVQVVDHKVGTGPKAKSGNVVSMRYIGRLQNGKIFDQNKSGKPFQFRLGQGEVIKGWDVGIVGMQPGGERILTIPAPMAYGKRAQQGIPANSTLTFEVKLLEIKN